MEKVQKGKTMRYAVAINSSGQATIPKEIRDDLKIVPGENRLIFERAKDGRYYLAREMTAREQLLRSLEKLRRMDEERMRTNPAYREAKEKYKGMSYEEIMDAYYDTPEGKKEFEEEYGIKL